MPEYLAPGVYVEETSFRSKSIEGVGTSTTGFVGATRFGPIVGEPELITSFSQFERIYGGLDPLDFEGVPQPNFLAHGVRAFFDNGGSRMYVARAYTPPDTSDGVASSPIPVAAPVNALATALAYSAASIAKNALDRARAAIERLRLAETTAAAIQAINDASAAVVAETTAGTAPAFDANNDDAATITAAITAWIGSDVTDAGEQAAATAELGVVTPTIEAAVALRDLTDGGITTADTTLGTLATAVSSGESFGQDENNAVPGGLDVQASYNALNGATANLNTELAAFDTAEAAFYGNNYPYDPGADPAAVEAAGDALRQAAEAVIPAADIATEIENAARDAQFGVRQAVANAAAFFRARFPGAAGNMSIAIRGSVSSNVLVDVGGTPTLRQVKHGDLLVLKRGNTAALYSATRANGSWTLTDSAGGTVDVATLTPGPNDADDKAHPIRISVEVLMPGKFAQPMLWDNLTVSGDITRNRDSVTQVFGEEISNRTQELETPLVITPPSVGGNLPADATLAAHLIGRADFTVTNDKVSILSTLQELVLADGSDGKHPEASEFEGQGSDDDPDKSGLKSFEDLEDISIIAAPGYSYNAAQYADKIAAINQALITHCHRMRYRVAVLDSPDEQALSQIRDYRAVMDSTHAALYYPWVRILDPVTNVPLNVPPSGFMTGIYARNDVENGVHKAPANEVVRGAIGLEVMLNKAQQDVLNPLGINCLRFFEGRGNRVWGARTISSDPEWKYLNVRRYFNYLERSIDVSTQWAVFEPNGETLWANVQRTVANFLYNEWVSDRLAGAKPEAAYFVRCDRSVMTQNDLDNGRMICLIGVAPLYPAEFVIFRIGQWTADSSS